MCRMMMSFGIKRKMFEIARRIWIENRDGWGIAYNEDGQWEDWHVMKSNVPVPITFLPKTVDGIFHIRIATTKRDAGGTHPFKTINNGKIIYYAHNGMIFPHDFDTVDSEMIGKYIDDKSGNLKRVMRKVIKTLNYHHNGTWNIVAMNSDEAFAYCDGSLVLITDDGYVKAIASDDRPFKFYNFKKQELADGEWMYFKKIDGKWYLEDDGRIEKNKYFYTYDSYKKSKWFKKEVMFDD